VAPERVLQAESAEIARASKDWEFALYSRLQIDANERSLLAKQDGGLLRFRCNPAVLGIAIASLEEFQRLLLEKGVKKALETAILTELVGQRPERDSSPESLRELFFVLDVQNDQERQARIRSWLREGENKKAQPQGPDALEVKLAAKPPKFVVEQIEDLKLERRAASMHVRRQAELDAKAAVVPSPQVLDRLLRYEAHLSREIDRTLSQLERLQRMRMGQAVPPPLKVEISR
jgi:hypothetical protein